MKHTSNYNLNMPDNSDFYDVEHMNENMEIIDSKLMENASNIAKHDINVLKNICPYEATGVFTDEIIYLEKLNFATVKRDEPLTISYDCINVNGNSNERSIIWTIFDSEGNIAGSFIIPFKDGERVYHTCNELKEAAVLTCLLKSSVNNDYVNIDNIQVEVGDKATAFEKFGGSTNLSLSYQIMKLDSTQQKMVEKTEKIDAIDASLSDYNLNSVFNGELMNGYYDHTTIEFKEDSTGLASTRYECKPGDPVRIFINYSFQSIWDGLLGIVFWDKSNNIILISQTSNSNTHYIFAPDDAYYCAFYVKSNEDMRGGMFTDFRFYIGNNIDKIGMIEDEVKELKEQQGGSEGFEKLNADFLTLKSGYTAGGKNLVNPNYIVQGGINGDGVGVADVTKVRTIFIAVESNTTYAFQINTEVLLHRIYEYNDNLNIVTNTAVIDDTSKIITTSSSTKYVKLLIRKSDNSTIVPSEVTSLMMEKNSAVTSYESYMQSVKKISEDLIPYKLSDMFNGILLSGYYSGGNHIGSSTSVCSLKYDCNPGEAVTVKYPSSDILLAIVFWNATQGHIATYTKRNSNEFTIIAPENAKYCAFYMQKISGSISPSTAKMFKLYIGNTIEALKGELINRVFIESADSNYVMAGSNKKLAFSTSPYSFFIVKNNADTTSIKLKLYNADGSLVTSGNYMVLISARDGSTSDITVGYISSNVLDTGIQLSGATATNYAVVIIPLPN